MYRKVLGVIAGIVFVSAALAWEQTKVEYSADTVMETAEGVMKGRVYHAANKERRDMVMQGQTMAMILRQDKRVVWNLMPEEKMYMEMPIGGSHSSADDLSQYKIEQTTVGPETVNGIATTKSKIVMTHANGTRMGGFWWTSKDGIVVKVDAIAAEKKNKMRLKMELSNLKIGRQDAKLFEIPAGYSKMSMPGMGGFDPKDAMKMMR